MDTVAPARQEDREAPAGEELEEEQHLDAEKVEPSPVLGVPPQASLDTADVLNSPKQSTSTCCQPSFHSVLPPDRSPLGWSGGTLGAGTCLVCSRPVFGPLSTELGVDPSCPALGASPRPHLPLPIPGPTCCSMKGPLLVSGLST